MSEQPGLLRERVSAASIGIGIETLRANPLRTLLSTLGIIMGAGALVSVLALGDAMQRYAREQIEKTTDLQTIPDGGWRALSTHRCAHLRASGH